MNTQNPSPRSARIKALWIDKRSMLTRLKLAGCALFSFCFTFFFFGPYEQVALNHAFFAYRHEDVFLPMAITMLICAAAGSIALSLLRGKVFNYALSAVFSFGVCCYLQGTYMNGSLGPLTGDPVDWTIFQHGMLFNSLIWFLVFFLVYLVLYLSRRIWRAMITFVSMLLVVMQLVPTVCIAAGILEQTHTAPISNYSFQDSGIYEFSENENVFVFVLDRLDYDYIDSALQSKPDMLAGFDGFTMYTNAMSAYARTLPALNHLMTAHEETAYRIPSGEHFDISWTADGKNILQDLTDQDYSIEIYAKIQNMFSNPEFAIQYVSNITDQKPDILPLTLVMRLVKLSCYRYLPLAFKPFFLMYTNFYNTGVFVNNHAYEVDDARYAPGFSTSTADRTKNCFKFYHFFGPHAPYTLTADGKHNPKGTSLNEQTLGSFHILTSIFDRMKELGIYENASIIVTGDHGYAVRDDLPLSKATRIGIFYKPSGNAGTPIAISNSPVSTGNIPATILKAAGADYSKYGRALDEIAENEELTRKYYKSITSAGVGESLVYVYEVTGDASSFDNWKHTESFEISPQHQFY